MEGRKIHHPGRMSIELARKIGARRCKGSFRSLGRSDYHEMILASDYFSDASPFNVWDLGIAIECELERALRMQIYRCHGSPEYEMSKYGNQKHVRQRRLPC